ncbi:hypothetical protein [Azospirillum canadense]|uniref:hypothetical protein n=1 Tax=Azospirillum canadense TaxID=403962 RepID=UPI002226BBD0|nr:hypothetical protein [Azospirillum canadense]MCW2243144.1 hypothetical protein [Azospirillum canadense]
MIARGSKYIQGCLRFTYGTHIAVAEQPNQNASLLGEPFFGFPNTLFGFRECPFSWMHDQLPQANHQSS